MRPGKAQDVFYAMSQSFDRYRNAVLLFFAALGTSWAFTRGGHDFEVYYHAAELVRAGRGAAIYVDSPDRFLYAPGFAWLFVPFTFLPKALALATWCALKALALHLGLRASLEPGEKRWAGALGLLVFARPLLIDFQYGQLNALLVAFALIALSTRRFLPWFALGVLAVTKLLILPLCLIPFLGPHALRDKRARGGVVAGAFALLVLPLIFGGHLDLYKGWLDALLNKGLPPESHNQSFNAFLLRFFTGMPTQVLGAGPKPIAFGFAWLTSHQIQLIALAWSLLLFSALGWLLLRKSPRSLRDWGALVLGTLILPSHLIWKPYFVFGIPAAVRLAAREPMPLRWLIVAALAVNFTTFDFVGGNAHAFFEAASLLLWVHVALLAKLARSERPTVSISV